MTLELFESVVRRNIYYEAECDEHGARVVTNLSNTICPGCKQRVEPNVEHLCGNRVVVGKKKSVEKKEPSKVPLSQHLRPKKPRMRVNS